MTSGSNKENLVGSLLGGRYEVLCLVSEGGMGALYKARHIEVGRLVAIKVLHEKLAEKERNLKRFHQEAQIAGSLSHPNLTAVFDSGQTESGSPYLVMDYLTGMSLAELIKQDNGVDADRAMKIFFEVCDGLSYLHGKGLIHRDLKPANIMLCLDNDEETAKLVDFGIAKELAPGETQGLTQTGEIFGSPLYMSPEQCRGDRLDARSDIYSLGCVMYETLTGIPPIKGDTIVHTIYKHLNQNPAPLATVREDLSLPERLEEIIFKAMEKDPAKRYQSVREISRDLKNVDAVIGFHRAPPKLPHWFPMLSGLLLAAGVCSFLFVQSLSRGGIPPAARQFNADRSISIISYSEPAAQESPEVIVLATHQAYNQGRSMDEDYALPGDVYVCVSPAHQKPLVLVLSSFAPVCWHVDCPESVTIKQVILSGFCQQQVTGLKSSVPVEESSDNLPPDRKENPHPPFANPTFNLSEGEDVARNPGYQELSGILQNRHQLRINKFQYCHQSAVFDI